MRILIIIIFSLLSCTGKGQILGLNKQQSSPAPPDSTPIFIVFAGESNSGGLAANSYATAPELAKRSIKILNNTTKASFDSLDIGSNNLIGHLGLIYAKDSAHGFELQIANKYDSNYFAGRRIYLCKAGQGGTKISQWDSTYTAEGYTYHPLDTMLARVNAAISLVAGETDQTPITVMFWSQGINDGVSNVAAWKTATKDMFTRMRDSLNITLPIVMTQFQSLQAGSLSALDNAMADIVNEMSNVYVVNTTGAESTEVYAGPGSHWGYEGMKVVANKLLEVLMTQIL